MGKDTRENMYREIKLEIVTIIDLNLHELSITGMTVINWLLKIRYNFQAQQRLVKWLQNIKAMRVAS